MFTDASPILCTIVKVFETVFLLAMLMFLLFWIDNIRGKHRPRTLAFFHPFVDDRVLWNMLHSLLKSPKIADVTFIIYTGCQDSAESVIAKAATTFGVSLHGAANRVEFIYLERFQWLLNQRCYGWLRTLTAIVTAFDALCLALPEVIIDMRGYGFAYPVFRVCGSCRVLYFPQSVTLDAMLLNHPESLSSLSRFSQSSLLLRFSQSSSLSRFSSKIFIWSHAFCMRFAERLMTNSTWMYNHTRATWPTLAVDRIKLVYPPCRLDLLDLPLAPRQPWILSMEQFRPGMRV